MLPNDSQMFSPFAQENNGIKVGQISDFGSIF